MTTPALDAALAPFRAVAPVLRDWLPARALQAGMASGLTEALVAGPVTPAALAARTRLPERGVTMLLALLGPLVTREGQMVAAAPVLREAWPHRALLEAKLADAARALPDAHAHLEALLFDTPRFMAESATFALFRYDRALTDDAAARAATAPWVAITTALSRHEAPVLAAWRGWQGRLLDIGGNSGETARGLCAAHPGLEVTVADLPAVCALGRAHLAGAPEAARIRFHPCDLRGEDPPGGFDAVLLKSVLHDWPPPEAARLLRRAAAALGPGGTLVIFERARLPGADYGTLPDLLFHAFYRDGTEYAPMLHAAGFALVACETLQLDVPFLAMEAVLTPG